MCGFQNKIDECRRRLSSLRLHHNGQDLREFKVNQNYFLRLLKQQDHFLRQRAKQF